MLHFGPRVLKQMGVPSNHPVDYSHSREQLNHLGWSTSERVAAVPSVLRQRDSCSRMPMFGGPEDLPVLVALALIMPVDLGGPQEIAMDHMYQT